MTNREELLDRSLFQQVVIQEVYNKSFRYLPSDRICCLENITEFIFLFRACKLDVGKRKKTVKKKLDFY